MRARLKRGSFARWIIGAVGVLFFSGGIKAEDGILVLDRFSELVALASDEEILGLVGFYGQPTPQQWLVLSGVNDGERPLRESVVANGKLLGERHFSPLPGQDVPHLPLLRAKVRLSSDAAFRITQALAKSRGREFDSVHFQLRVREEGAEPVWMLKLINTAQVSIGVVYLSAVDGVLLEETWMKLPEEEEDRMTSR